MKSVLALESLGFAAGTEGRSALGDGVSLQVFRFVPITSGWATAPGRVALRWCPFLPSSHRSLLTMELEMNTLALVRLGRD
jgi:hypothetical protein